MIAVVVKFIKLHVPERILLYEVELFHFADLVNIVVLLNSC